MTKARVVETDQGIQGQFNVQTYDQMLRRMRDKGWMETDLILKAGIQQGVALEVGPGPGYLGLEWLKKTHGTRLKGLEISVDMIGIAQRNAKEYGLDDRVEYVKGDAQGMPFDESMFDGVFTNGSLHEWSQTKKVRDELHRVLKPGGRFFISDLRRDMHPLVQWVMRMLTQPAAIRPGLVSSINASYTVDEIRAILQESRLKGCEVRKSLMGLLIVGEKAG